VTFDRRTVVLGVAAAAAVAAATTVAVAKHHEDISPERKAVTAYIERVNAIQKQMHVPLARVLLAFRHFADPKTRTADVPAELAEAAATLETLDRKLRAEPSPPQARVLRARLLVLIDGQAAVTREVRRMAAFSPPYATALQDARRANTRLSAALRSIAVPRPHALKGTKQQVLKAQRAFRAAAARAAHRQADAIETYVRAVDGIVGRLQRLVPPEVLAPVHAAQIRAFRRIHTTGRALADELRKAKRGDVETLGRNFALSSRYAQSTGVQRAEIAAIRRYNARARALSAAAARVEQELGRLQRRLP
jgi:hypothetical protein